MSQTETAPGEIEIVDPTLTPGWDEFMASQPNATIFHSSAWAALLKNTYAQRPMYLMADSGLDGKAVWPIMEIDSPLTGRRGISLPFTDYCEPVLPSSAMAEKLFQAACEIGRNRGWRYFEFRGGRACFLRSNALISFWGHVIPLHHDAEMMMRGCESAVRRALKKATQLEVCSDVSQSLESLRAFFRLHCLTRRKHGLPPQPFAFFENIHRYIIAKGKGFLSMAMYNGQPVAAGIYFHSGENALYKFGASDHNLQHLRGNNVMMWNAMLRCAALGCKYLHLGRTSSSNAGLRRFKLGWGAREEALDYFRFDLKRGFFVSGTDKAFGWHNHVFRALPMPLSRMIGSLLYRHMG